MTFSKNRINKAGITLANTNSKSDEISSAMDVLSYWRGSHEMPLETAFESLQRISTKIDKHAIFAKRLKRTASIVLKLRRSEGRMQLGRMHDVGGCRAVISTEKKLRKIARELKKIPELKNSKREIRVYDYITSPKNDGYRSLHIVGMFRNEFSDLRCIEIQVRTRIQHYWATAVEIVDLFTGQALKSNQGEQAWKDFFAAASRQFSVMERVHVFSQLEYKKQFQEYSKIVLSDRALLDDCLVVQKLASSVGALKTFEAFARSIEIIDDHLSAVSNSGYVLLEIDTEKRVVSPIVYDSKEFIEAERAYILLEKATIDDPKRVVALVSSAALGGIKQAYPNYFADSTGFLKLLNIIENIRGPERRGILQRIIGL